MRINGRRAMPQLIPAAAQETRQQTHFSLLADHCSWAESSRAYAVQNQTPLTQRIAAMGRMEASINQTQSAATCQSLFNEHIARVEGISAFEEEPFLDGSDD